MPKTKIKSLENNLKSLLMIFLLLMVSIDSIAQGEPDQIIETQVTIESGLVRAESGIYFKTTTNNQNILTRPIIICEGIDPINYMDFDEIYTQVDGRNLGLLGDLRSIGFDVVVVNLLNNPIEIQKNSILFQNVLDDVNNILEANNSLSRSTVIGISMGGLITRSALVEMENSNIDHRVENYISWDAPQRGANIPLGLQHFADYYVGPVIDIMEDLAFLEASSLGDVFNRFNNWFIEETNFSLSNSAALQMATYYKNSNPLRASFVNYLNGIGYPQNTWNIGVSMGSSGSEGGQGFAAGAEIIRWRPGIKILDEEINLPFNLGTYRLEWYPFSFNTVANSMPGNSGVIFQGQASIQPFINYNVVLNNRTNFFTDGDFTPGPTNSIIDNVPGAFFDIEDVESALNDAQNTEIDINWTRQYCTRLCVPWTNICTGEACVTVGIDQTIVIPWSELIGRVESETNYAFTFIPTLSALDIDSDNWYLDVKGIEGYPYTSRNELSPFDAIYSSERNAFHATLAEADMATFVADEIAPANMFIQNREFSENYTNRFEAENIYIGRNVDPNTARNSQGDVLLNTGANIEFAVPQAGEVVISSGFNSNGGDFRIVAGDENVIMNRVDYKTKATEMTKNDLDTHLSSKVDEKTVDSYELPEIHVNYTSSFKSLNSIESNGMIENESSSTNISFVKAYPNPISKNSKIYFNNQNVDNYSIDVIDLQGKSMITIVNHELLKKGIFKFEIPFNQLEDGVYTVRIKAENYFETIKIIK